MEQRRVALIFAVDEYDHPDLQRLSSPVADADALAETLGRPELGGFSVEICHNLSSAAAAEKLEDFLVERRPSDLALLHFSCHGLKDDSGSLYLAAKNTVPTRLASTAIDATLVNLLMRKSRARSIVLLLDCCYGGAFERGMTARAAGNVAVRDQFSQEPLGGGRGRAVITASSAVQYAFEGTRLADRNDAAAPSLFTGAVVAGIRTGEADRDGDGFISLSELYDHVYERVLEQTPHQTPSKWEYGLEGGLVIARSPRRIVRPAELPDQLVEVIHHAYPVVRRGAVEELARMANGSDLPSALAALEALRALSDDDSRSVATAASAAVDALTVKTSLPALSFGEVTVGSEPELRAFDLIGPPLVETAEVSADPITFAAQLDGRSVRVRMDVSTAGLFRGTLRIRSPLGEVVLPVTGEVREMAPGVPQRTETAITSSRTSDPTMAVAADQAAHEQQHQPLKLRAEGHSAAIPLRLGLALAASGGVLIGFALFVPWGSGTFFDTGPWYDSLTPKVLQVLPCLVIICSAGALMIGRWESTAYGGLSSAVLVSLELLAVFVVYVLSNPDASFEPGVLTQVGGILLALAGSLIALRTSDAMTSAVTTRSDWRSFTGLIVVMAGLTIATTDLARHDETVAWMWVFPAALALVAVPIPLVQMTGTQRTAALTMVTGFVILTYDDLPWLTAAGAYPWVGESDWWTLCLPPVIVLIGCFIGQMGRRHPLGEPDTQEPEG